jgi:hypothetical protein
MPKPEQYFARVCWNESNWTRPTGHAPELETDTYVTYTGFGHEEWLFNYEWMLGGYKYGFLQPVNKSWSTFQGRTMHVLLYAIGPNGDWRRVGEIGRCEILTEDAARDARRRFERRGWLADLLEHVRAVDGKVSAIKPARSILFNVRFRREDARLYDEHEQAIDADDPLRKLRRYTLVPVANKPKLRAAWNDRAGSTEPKKITRTKRRAVAAGTVDLAEARLQDALFALLVAKHGKGAVLKEEHYCDLRIQRGRGVTLIEVKNDARPRYAIRAALGQLLHYAFLFAQKGKTVRELVAVAPGKLRDADRAFLAHLRKAVRIPLRYVEFNQEMTAVDL